MTTDAITYDFDTIPERRGTSCYKWDLYDADVLPLFVAEMDFKAPAVITDAMKRRVDHGFFGYTAPPEDLKDVLVARMKERYDWDIKADWLLFNPGMVLMLNVFAQAAATPGDGAIIQTPVYGPFMAITKNRNLFAQHVDLVQKNATDNTFHYEIDFDALEAAITPQTSTFFLCDPHNPAGRIYRRDELEKIAEICLKHDITIAADGIHGDLILSEDLEYIPISALSPEVGRKSVTMIAPSKTFNLPGSACTVAIIPDDALREKMVMTSRMSGYHVDALAYEAALAAYRDADEWLQQALAYIRRNRDVVVSFIQERLPMLKTTVPEATYLAWIDCSALDIGNYATAQEFFLKEAKVSFTAGDFFGPAGRDFVRLNFACPRSMLDEALERMEQAIKGN